MLRLKDKIYEFMQEYRKNIIGSIAILFGFLVPILMVAIGIAIDLGQSYQMKERLCGALDASVLSGVATYEDPDAIETRFNEFLAQNFPDSAVGEIIEIESSIGDDEITVDAIARYPTTFMGIVGKSSVDVACQTKIHRAVMGLEVALVLDVTGSMAGSKISSLRDATEAFITTMESKTENPESVKIGMVPYTVAVNVGSIAPSLVEDLPEHAGEEVPYRYVAEEDDQDNAVEWRGCVKAREYPNDTYDVSIEDGGYWEPYWWQSSDDDPSGYDSENEWDSNTSTFSAQIKAQGTYSCYSAETPNMSCPEYNPIIPLVDLTPSNYDMLLDAADNLISWCRGGTMSNVGTIWGYRVLSPEAPFTEGSSWEDDRWQKVAVIMTDGQNQFYKQWGVDGWDSDYSAYGHIDQEEMGPGINTQSEGYDEMNDRFLKTCADMRSKGIKIYTVVFAYNSSSVDQLFTSCAGSADRFYEAPSTSELVEVFEELANDISSLHVTY